MKMKSIKFLFVIFIVVVSILPLQSVVALNVVQNREVINEEKIFSNANVNGDFAEDRVLVVLNKSESNMLKEHTIDDFSEIDVKKVRDLTENTKTMIKNKRREIVTNNLQRGDTSVSEVIDNGQFNQILSIELNSTGKANVIETIKKLETRNDILYAGPDYAISATSVEPNDILYSEQGEYKGQWGHQQIQLPDAWSITTGSSEVVVGVIDTGINGSHPDLQGQIDTALCRDFTSGETVVVTSPIDPRNHGTLVAGIIGAKGNNVTGISGVCWNVKLASLRILDEQGYGYSSYLISAIDYASSQNIPILNFSGRWDIALEREQHNEIDGAEFESSYNVPVDMSIANYPGLFVCSAGNEYKNNDDTNNEIYPVQYNIANMIVVANTTEDDELFHYISSVGTEKGSNYGATTVHLSAPGTEILSAYTCTAFCYLLDIHLTDGYHYDTGTSFSAPYVTGVAALIKSIRPDLTAKEIKALILDNVDVPLDENGNKKLADKCITEGRLNAYKAVKAATESQTFTGDVNGDGQADIILSRNIDDSRAITVYLGQSNGKFSEPITTISSRSFYYGNSSNVGDFDGDGLTDVVIHWNNNGYRQLLVYRSRGDGGFYEGTNLSSGRAYISNTLTYSIHIDDVNGDNKDDFIVYYKTNTGNRNALVYKGTSSSPYLVDATTNAIGSSDAYYACESVYTGDFNGDNRADILVHWANSSNARQLKVYLGTANGSFLSGGNLSSTRSYYPSHNPTKNYIADVDGDGNDDFVVHWKNGSSGISVSVYRGSSSSPYVYDAPTDAIGSTNPYNETDPIFLGVINGDGSSDMVVHTVDSDGYRQLYVYTLDGSNATASVYSTLDLHNPSEKAERILLADVNGDGRDDIIVKSRDFDGDYYNVHLMTYLGTSSGSFSSAVSTVSLNSIPFYNSDYVPSYLRPIRAGNYKIINVGAYKCLNVSGDNVTALYNNQNVCLWEDSGTNEQRWYVTGSGNNQYIKSVINTNFGLNVYRAGNPWNCDLYPIAGNETDSLIDLIETDGGYKIKLHNYDLYLTAASYANGANVYWGAASTSTYQLWNFVSA